MNSSATISLSLERTDTCFSRIVFARSFVKMHVSGPKTLMNAPKSRHGGVSQVSKSHEKQMSRQRQVQVSCAQGSGDVFCFYLVLPRLPIGVPSVSTHITSDSAVTPLR